MGPGIAVGMGVIAVIVGIILKPHDEEFGWSPLWGLAENSSPIGKCVFVAGVLVAAWGVHGWRGV